MLASLSNQPPGFRFASVSPLTLNLIAGVGYFALAFGAVKLLSPWGIGIPFFPAAGWAFVWAVLYGRRVLSGLGLGVLTFQIAYIGLDSMGLAGFAIVLGAMLQAYAAADLSQRLSGVRSIELIQDRDIVVLFLLLPATCLLSSTIGVGSLVWSGAVSENDFFVVWRDWWLGDSLGMVLAVPLALRWLTRRSSAWGGSRRITWVTTAVLLMVLLLLSLQIQKQGRDKARDEINNVVQDVRVGISNRLSAFGSVLQSLRTWFVLDPDLSYQRFGEFAESLLGANEEVAALSFNAYITEAERPGFEARASARLGSSFEVKSRGADGKVGPVTPDGRVYVPVTYIAPLAQNRGAVGFDINSEPVRRVAIAAAIKNASTSVTAPITLVQDGLPGVLMLTPAFSFVQKAGDLAQRDLFGFAVAVVRLEPLMTRVAKGMKRPIGFRLYAPGKDEPVLASGEAPPASVGGPMRQNIEFADQQWALEAWPLDWPVSAGSLFGIWPPLLLLLIAILYQVSFLILSGRRILIEQEVQTKTKALRDRQEEMERSQDAGKVGTWSRGVDGRYAVSSQVASIVRGGLSQDLGIVDLRRHLLAEDQSAFDRALKRAHQSGRFDMSVRIADGDLIKWVKLSGRFETDEQGGRIEFGTIQDVTDLMSSLDRFDKVLQGATDVVLLLDVRGRAEQWNPAAEHVFGNYLLDAKQKAFFLCIACSADRLSSDPWVQFLQNPDGIPPPGRHRLTLQMPVGETRTLELSVFQFVDAAGVHGLCVMHDVSAQVSARRHLEEAKEAAEAANRAKTEFLAVMSHEVRTPMNAVLGLLPGLLRSELNERQRDDLLAIKQSGESMMGLLNDILDFSSLQANSVRLVSKPLSIQLLASSVVSLHRGAARDKGLSLTMEVEEACASATYLGDEEKLRQILNNFLSNAIKFTSQGKVILRVKSLAAQAGDGGGLRLEIADTGPGIPAEAKERLFNRFTQADGSVKRRYGGIGLGLSICKQLALLMNGSIGVESEPGYGSVFWVEIPLPMGHAPDLPDAQPGVPAGAETPAGHTRAAASNDDEPERFSGLVLVVEDNALNRLVARRLLEDVGLRVETAGNGRLGVERLAEQALDKVDLVLMDMHMPEMGGLEATKAIRAAAWGQQVPIVAVTAAAYEEDRARALSAGMNDFLVKPLRESDVRAILRQFLSPDTRAGSPAGGQNEEKNMSTPAHEDKGGDPAGFDLSELRSIFGSDEQGLAETLQLYANDLGQWVPDWKAAQFSKDADAMCKLSHTLVGSSGMCGATQTSTLARQVNVALHESGQAPDDLVARLMASVEDNLHQLALRGHRPM